jgi:hypothetical protein
MVDQFQIDFPVCICVATRLLHTRAQQNTVQCQAHAKSVANLYKIQSWCHNHGVTENAMHWKDFVPAHFNPLTTEIVATICLLIFPMVAVTCVFLRYPENHIVKGNRGYQTNAKTKQSYSSSKAFHVRRLGAMLRQHRRPVIHQARSLSPTDLRQHQWHHLA